jgi:ribosomal protein L1
LMYINILVAFPFQVARILGPRGLMPNPKVRMFTSFVEESSSHSAVGDTYCFIARVCDK